MADDASGTAPPWRDLFTRLIADNAAGNAETTLAAAVYHDPARHAAEMDRLFRKLPLCLGAADQLRAPGTVLAREIAGIPLLLARDAAGDLNVFVNACRHRGARLLAPQDTPCPANSLTCRYHGWTYNLDGSLAAVPRREAFPTLDRATRGLRRIPATVRHGLIWAVLDPAANTPPDMADYLGPLDAEFTALGVGNNRFFRQNAVRRAANWKLMIDAFLEVYHVKRLHAGTIGPFFSDSRAVCDHPGPHQRMLAGRENLGTLGELPEAELNPRVHGTLVHLVFPNTIMVYHPDYTSHIASFPIAPGEALFVHTMLVPEDPRDEKARTHWDRSFDLIDRQVFNAEDLAICEEIQAGIAPGYNENFLLGRLEAAVAHFHASIEAALA